MFLILLKAEHLQQHSVRLCHYHDDVNAWSVANMMEICPTQARQEHHCLLRFYQSAGIPEHASNSTFPLLSSIWLASRALASAL